MKTTYFGHFWSLFYVKIYKSHIFYFLPPSQKANPNPGKSTNTEFLKSINGIEGTIDSGASNFSTFDKQDFVEGTYKPCDKDIVMRGIAGGLTING